MTITAGFTGTVLFTGTVFRSRWPEVVEKGRRLTESIVRDR